MRVATYFDNESWEKYGQSWRDLDKIGTETVAVCSINLAESSKDEVSKVFDSVCFSGNYFYDVCNSLIVSSFFKEETGFLLCAPHKVVSPVSTDRDAFCLSENKERFSSVLFARGITSLVNRAEAVRILDSLFEDSGGFLDSSFIWGTSDFWIGFTGFQRCLKKSDYLPTTDENFGDLALSLFYKVSSSFSVEVKK